MDDLMTAGTKALDVRWRLAVLMVLTTAGVGVSLGSADAAPALSGFTATASAQGGRADFTVPGFAVVERVADAGGPVSQSAVDGSSAISFASAPYPGELVVTGPGLFAGFTGIEPPGGYPFYVEASHPTIPEQSLGDPAAPYELLARAAAGATSGRARIEAGGGDGKSGGSGGSRAVTSAVVAGDTVTATGETINEGLSFGGGALRIASVRSRSVTTYRAGQSEPVTKTELFVDGGSANGTTFGVGPDGLVAAGQGVPIPTGSALDQVNAALKPAGISIRFAGAQKLVGGASADALEVTLAGQAPIPGTPPGVITVRFGGATSAVTIGDRTGGLVPPVEGVGGSDGSAVPSPSTGADEAAAAATGGDQAAGAPSAVTAGAPTLAGRAYSAVAGGVPPIPTVSGSVSRVGGIAAPAPLPGVAAGSTPQVVTGLAQPILHPRRLGTEGVLYWVVIGAGMLMLAVASLWRAKGVLSL